MKTAHNDIMRIEANPSEEWRTHSPVMLNQSPREAPTRGAAGKVPKKGLKVKTNKVTMALLDTKSLTGGGSK